MSPVGFALIAIVAAPNVSRAQVTSPPTGPTTGCAGTASAATAPFLRLFVNGVCTDLSSLFTPAAPGIWNATTTLTLSQATVFIKAQVQSDPFITFSATTTNAVPGSVNYAFVFGTPVTPGMYTGASSSGGFSVSPGVAQNTTVSAGGFYPTYIAGYGSNGPFTTNLGVDLGTAPCVATGTATATCNLGTTSSTFSPTYFDNLEALFSYSQDDLQSAAAFTGRIDLNEPVSTVPGSTVPEPGTLSLVATGLIGLAGVVRRKRRLGA